MPTRISGSPGKIIQALRERIPRIQGPTGILPKEKQKVLVDITGMEEISAADGPSIGVGSRDYRGVQILPVVSFAAQNKARICVTGTGGSLGPFGRELSYFYIPKRSGRRGILSITFH